MIDPTREPRYTQDDFTEALATAGLPQEMQQLVLDSLATLRGQRAAEQQQRRRQTLKLEYAICYRRVADPNHSDSNIEGWYDSLDDCASALLRDFAAQPEGTVLSDLDTQVRDVSAVTLAIRELELGNGFEGGDAEQLIHRAGVTTQELLSWLSKGMLELLQGQNPDRTEEQLIELINRNFPNVDALQTILPHPKLWERVVGARADQMLQTMQAEGFTLPPLDEEGKYGPEDNPDEDYDVWNRGSALPGART